ncbi:DUF3826 domain-containing protein [Oleiharenicola lentus]|uniref:DUF3826 domain-containing protein n=1 Tax=Oleiharenicola lentus TaxID=2508720 RepID=UPI003F66B30C
MIRVVCAVACVLLSSVFLHAQTPPLTATPVENDAAVFERRIGGRADKIMERLSLTDATLARDVRNRVLKFYRDLHAAHADRDQQLIALASGDPHQINRVNFNADKHAHQVYGEFVGALARDLDDTQIEAIKDWMTFDLQSLSVDEYRRMFPTMTARQQAQILAWITAAREAAVIAGSAETKLDVYRVNKLRMHAYLSAQGFDVETAVKAEAARKAALKKLE